MELFEVITGDFASDFTCELRWNEVATGWVSYAIHCSSMRSRVYSLVFTHYNACNSCVFQCDFTNDLTYDITSPWPIISKVRTCEHGAECHTCTLLIIIIVYWASEKWGHIYRWAPSPFKYTGAVLYMHTWRGSFIYAGIISYWINQCVFIVGHVTINMLSLCFIMLSLLLMNF